ncbi:MAG: flagellar assembly protein FliW [Armatimonadota bacterium]
MNTPLTQTIVQTRRFGPVVVPEEDMIQFVAPLAPFGSLLRYVLLSDPQEEPFLWLQSLDQPALCLIVAPHEAIAGKAPALSVATCAELGLRPDEQPEAYVIISPAEDPRQTTMNLLAPLYLCRRTRLARQLIIEADASLARVPLP